MGAIALEMRTVTGVGIGERATIGKLRAAESGAIANGSEIAVCSEPITRQRVIELFEAGFSAIICFGECEEDVAESVKKLAIPTLFVSEEVIGECACGENAVLYPNRGVLFISPTVEIMDGFVCSNQSEAPFEAGVKISRVHDRKSGALIGRAVETDGNANREDDLFEIYCRLAEDIGGEIIVCMSFRENLSEQLRALMRAAVYGRLSLAFSAASMSEYYAFRELWARVKTELLEEGREFDGGVAVGAVADGLFGLLYASELSEKSDFFMVDLTRIAGEESVDGRDDFCERFVDAIYERLSSVPSDFRVIGRTEIGTA